MTSVTVRAAAKINLRLGVGRVRDDGYHPLDTVYQAIGLYDDVSVTPADDWTLTMAAHPRIDLAEVPLDDRNIAVRAARALIQHHRISDRATIHIEKGIPVAGGLAGGSADAAATLLALDRLWDLGTSDADLLAIAATLGSDVPFALLGGTASGGGRGELVHPLEDNGTWWWVVVENDAGLSTPAVYAEYDRMGLPDAAAAPDQPADPGSGSDSGLDSGTGFTLADALRSGDPMMLAELVGNDLTAPALNLRPDLATTLQDGRDSGALAALLSGSGPTCLFLCSDSLHATAVRIGLNDRGHTRVQACAAPVAGAHEVSYE